jgi:hypothetical protein
MKSVEDFEREYGDILDAIRAMTYEWRHWSREAQKDITESISPDPHVDGPPTFIAFIRFEFLGWEYSISRLNVENDWTSGLPDKRSELSSMCIRRGVVLKHAPNQDIMHVSYGRADTVADLIAWLEVEFGRACHLTDDDEDDEPDDTTPLSEPFGYTSELRTQTFVAGADEFGIRPYSGDDGLANYEFVNVENEACGFLLVSRTHVYLYDTSKTYRANWPNGPEWRPGLSAWCDSYL